MGILDKGITQEDLTGAIENAEAVGQNVQMFDDATHEVINNAVKASEENGLASSAVQYQAQMQGVKTEQQAGGYDSKKPNPVDYQVDRLYPQEYFPTGEKSNMQGTYSGSIVGNVPLYSAGNVRLPFSIIDRRDRNIAQAKEKERTRRAELFEIMMVRGADQYNRQLNSLMFEYVEKNLSENNYDIDELMTYNTPESLNFWKGVRDIKLFGNETVRVNTMMTQLLADDADPTKHVTDQDRKAAKDWLGGSMDINNFYDNNADFTKMKERIDSHSNLMSALKDFNPTLDKMFLNAAQNGTLFSEGVTTEMIDEWTKKAQAGDQSLWTTEFMSFVSPDRIEDMAKVIKESGDFVQSQDEVEEYLVAMFGKGQVSLDKVVLDAARNRNTTNVNIKMPGENATDKPNPVISMITESMYDDDSEYREAAINMLEDMDGMDPNDPNINEKITKRMNDTFPDMNWSINDNGEVYGTIKLPDNLNNQEINVPLSSKASEYRIQNLDGTWTTLDKTDNKKGAYFDENGNLKADVTLVPIAMTGGLENEKAGRAVNKDDLVNGLVNNDNSYFGMSLSYKPVRMVEVDAYDNKGKKIKQMTAETDAAAPIIIKTFNMKKSPERQAMDEILTKLQDTEYQNQKSSNQRVQSASTQGNSSLESVRGGR